jgi:hypothetical protein
MVSLADTINTSMSRLDVDAADHFVDMLQDFCALDLEDEERLIAIASAIAYSAVTNHGKHVRVYLEAVKSWALEISAAQEPDPLRLHRLPRTRRIEDAMEILSDGVERLISLMAENAMPIQDRLVVELALLAQLCAQFDANTIHLSLMEIATMIDRGDFSAGDLVRVPVRDRQIPHRGYNLHELQPRGMA